MKQRRLFFAVIFIVLFIIILSRQAFSTPNEDNLPQQPDEARAVLQEINAWRVSKNLWPVSYNPTLEAMALYQAQYVRTLRPIPSGAAIHRGREGEGPRERALYPQFNWPTYGRHDFIQVGEIAWVGRRSGAFGFWRESKPHRETVENPRYREIGIAAIPHPYGYIYLVNFGSEPDVLTAAANPEAGKLYLTNELFPHAGPWIHTAREVRLFDHQGKPLEDDWLPWQQEIPLPQGLRDRLYVMYTDGTVQTMTEVSLRPEDLVFAQSESEVPTESGTPTPQQVSQEVCALPTTTPPPTGLMTLVYDDRSLSLLNLSGRGLNLADITLGNVGGITMRATRWDTQYLSGSIYAFPSGDCLQTWSWDESGHPRQPQECRNRRGVVNIAPSDVFWTSDFNVYYRGNVLATCTAGGGRCQFQIPN